MVGKDKISIVIVTFNGMHWLKRCLESCGNYSVVVVDNSSTDETVSYIKHYFPKVFIIEQSQNLGFGRANNIGVSYALNQGAEHVFLLNQDAYLVGDVVKQLLMFQKAHSEYGIVSPVHITPDQKRLDARFSNYLTYRYNPDFYSDFVLGNALKDVYELPFVNAAAWLISKECLLTVGGFDPLFFHYGEDDNYCQRVRFHGLKIGVLPKCYMIHDRVDRSNVKPDMFSDEYLNGQLRNYYVSFANVNNPKAIDKLNRKIQSLRKKRLKAKFFFKKESIVISREYGFLTEQRQAIEVSYNTNKKIGSHYLNVEIVRGL